MKPGPSDEEWREGNEAAAEWKRLRELQEAAQTRLYTIVRALYINATRPEIVERLGIPDDTVKWIVEDRAGKRRGRTARRKDTSADDQ